MSKKKPNPRSKARRLAHNHVEYVRYSRMEAGNCLYCPPNHGENLRGEHSKWGKKKAMKHYYATGKGRNERWVYDHTKMWLIDYGHWWWKQLREK